MVKIGGLQAEGKTSTLNTGELCYNIINVNVPVWWMCKIAIDLNVPSVIVLRKGVFNLLILLKLRSAVHVDMGYVNNVSINSHGWNWRLSWSIVSTKVFGVTLAFFPLHFCFHLLTSDLNLSLEMSMPLPK